VSTEAKIFGHEISLVVAIVVVVVFLVEVCRVVDVYFRSGDAR
jgi:hypothetical protein